MSVVYNDTQFEQEPQQGGGFLLSVEDHPYIALFVGLVIAVAIGYLVYKLRNGASSSTPASTTPVDGATGTNSSGQQVVYVPTSNTFLDYANYQNNNDTTTTTTSTINNPAPVSPPITTPFPVTGGQPPHQPISSPTSGWTRTYTVKGGDTLSSIAQRYNTTWHDIYNHNQSTIDSIANEHGSPIPGGPWNNIFPGETIHIP